MKCLTSATFSSQHCSMVLVFRSSSVQLNTAATVVSKLIICLSNRSNQFIKFSCNNVPLFNTSNQENNSQFTVLHRNI